MRTTLRIAALFLALAIAAFWFFGGANRGWTKTSVAHKQKDPVTELEVDVYEPRFVPGIDFLGGGLAVVVLVAGCSFLCRKQTIPETR
jgi:hypothetical protein